MGPHPVTLLAVAAAVSLALVLGALWALYGRLGDRTEGFVLAAGGGALMFSAVLELIVPAQEFISVIPETKHSDSKSRALRFVLLITGFQRILGSA